MEPLYPDEKIDFIVRLFEAKDIPYAIGGAIALFYWGEPRSTADIDINVFLVTSQASRVVSAIAAAGVQIDSVRVLREVAAVAQARFEFDGTPVDLFFADLPFHESCRARAVRVPFGNVQMNVLSAEDLVVCKVMFDRAKDWLDVEAVLHTRGPAFDTPYVHGWLVEMLGADNDRVRRFEKVAAEAASWPDEPDRPK